MRHPARTLSLGVCALGFLAVLSCDLIVGIVPDDPNKVDFYSPGTSEVNRSYTVDAPGGSLVVTLASIEVKNDLSLSFNFTWTGVNANGTKTTKNPDDGDPDI